ncbi:flavocytochrome c [Campylobacter sp. RM12640]|uniref:flavocytochrome c n=1 Tax=unclassified Campylobacter TaxID=2593542 RepID=UPI001BD98E95|nr:flavocytochrome c [Campylobacter sp. 2018MI13]MBT0883470.1 flavocytochrome c [Campylobacter sp. 2018MI13]MBZ7982794.1 flavocytochrome c [Campylobacter sp. RM12640]MBZ7990066.1 flavocytochrome c [Campylobacter sp. RM12635]
MKTKDRRDFLKFSGLVYGSILMPNIALSNSIDIDNIKWDEYYDAIVIGSGFAGSAAMLSLLDNGIKNVVMIDKMPYLGGNSAYSGGSMAVAGSKLQARDGIVDDINLHIQDTLKSGKNLNDLELVNIMINDGVKTLDWLIDNGVNFKWVSRSGGHSVPRSHSAGAGSYITRPLQEQILNRGGKILTRVIMDDILYDKNHKVVGIKVREKYQFNFERGYEEKNNESGITKYYRTFGGIILATGGWGADLKFRQIFDSSLRDDVLTTNHLGATGYTAQKLINDNVKFIDMQYIQSMHVTSQDEGGFGFAYRWITRAYAYGMMVNPKTGKRFVNEITDRKQGSDAILAMNEKGLNPPVLIMDINGTKTVDIEDLNRGLLVGAVKQFETMDELIAHYNINKEPFLEQLKRYNEYVELASKDKDYKDPEFNRNFSDYKGKYIKIEQAPFFAARPGPKVHHCMGGVKTNKDCEVYDNDMQLIQGLYACGEITGGRHGYNRLGSNAVLDCLVYGKRAGNTLAKNYNLLRG